MQHRRITQQVSVWISCRRMVHLQAMDSGKISYSIPYPTQYRAQRLAYGYRARNTTPAGKLHRYDKIGGSITAAHRPRRSDIERSVAQTADHQHKMVLSRPEGTRKGQNAGGAWSRQLGMPTLANTMDISSMPMQNRSHCVERRSRASCLAIILQPQHRTPVF